MTSTFVPLRYFISEAQTGPFGSQLHSEDYVEGQIPVINPSNIKDGRIVADLKCTVPPEIADRLSGHRLAVGDVIFARRGEIGRAALVPTEAEGWLCGTGSIRARVDPGALDLRFISYALQSAPVRSYFERLSVGSTMPNINTAILLAAPIPSVARGEQRRIADFLDAETARIDALVAMRARMRRLIALKREQVIERSLGFGPVAPPCELVPLKYIVATVSVGIVITPAKWYVETDGIPALRGLNVKPGAIDTSDLAHVSAEGHAENSKSRLRAGDVVVVRTGQAGAAAVVPPELDGANCIDLIIVRPGRKVIPKYLEYVLNSNYARSRVSEHAVGSIQAHFNVGSMKQIPIPSIPVSEQREIVHQIDQRVESLDQLFGLLARQEELLAERRQALITGAVTGQFDIWTASERAVGV